MSTQLYDTPEWKQFRERVFYRAKWLCQFCGRDLRDPDAHAQPHHRRDLNYGKFNEAELNDCIALCCRCHFFVECMKMNNVRIKAFVHRHETIKDHDYRHEIDWYEKALQEQEDEIPF